MNRSTLVLVITAVLVAGGFISLQIISSGTDNTLPVRIQTLNPEGSTFQVTGQQALIFLVYSAVATGSLIGLGVGLGQVFKCLDRETARTK